MVAHVCSLHYCKQQDSWPLIYSVNTLRMLTGNINYNNTYATTLSILQF